MEWNKWREEWTGAGQIGTDSHQAVGSAHRDPSFTDERALAHVRGRCLAARTRPQRAFLAWSPRFAYAEARLGLAESGAECRESVTRCCRAPLRAWSISFSRHPMALTRSLRHRNSPLQRPDGIVLAARSTFPASLAMSCPARTSCRARCPESVPVRPQFWVASRTAKVIANRRAGRLLWGDPRRKRARSPRSAPTRIGKGLNGAAR